MRKIDYIIIHTAAFKPETTVDEIRRWHLKRGWSDIGYHFVVNKSGNVSDGRSVERIGAHCLGMNRNSIGICCTGHGDFDPLTWKQLNGLLDLCKCLIEKYKISFYRIIGHREVNKLVEAAQLSEKYTTVKSCPGKQINMDEIRRWSAEKYIGISKFDMIG